MHSKKLLDKYALKLALLYPLYIKMESDNIYLRSVECGVSVQIKDKSKFASDLLLSYDHSKNSLSGVESLFRTIDFGILLGSERIADIINKNPQAIMILDDKLILSPGVVKLISSESFFRLTKIT